jgi:hypothetical protein
MKMEFPEVSADCWLANYKDDSYDLLMNDPEFALWLDQEYVPIAGGWLY